MLLDKSRWLAYTPALRDAVIDALLAREECLPVLLDAIESGVVPAWAIDSARRERLVKSHVASIRERAARVFTPQTSAERLAIFERYRPVVAAGGDRDRGKVVFEANCAACHRLEGIGSAVGPDLKTVQERDPVQLLGDILNPSAAITAGYSYYLIETVDGESLSGVVANESATAITLRQREGVETTVLRSNIESIYASSLSMMPEELEKTITPEQMADLIAFLKSAR